MTDREDTTVLGTDDARLKGQKLGNALIPLTIERARALVHGLVGRRCDIDSLEFRNGAIAGGVAVLALLNELGVLDPVKLVELDVDAAIATLS